MSQPTRYKKTKGYKYTLAEHQYVALRNFADVVLESPYFHLKRNVLHIYKGYSWDGASGPTWDTNDTITPSLVHDVLYQAIREGLLSPTRRFDADIEFYQLMRARARGLRGHFRAFYFFVGVRVGGWLSVTPKEHGEPMSQTFTAP